MDKLKLALALMLCLLAGAIGAAFTTPALSGWYVSLNKPALTPPNWVFAPVWIALYLMMSLSLYLVWQKGTDKWEVREGMLLFGVQLILNSLWSIAFFGMHTPLYGLFVIVALLAAISLTIARFWSISRPAAWLLVPYLLWVGFASYLNYSVWQLN
jgi:tryptophan-rich sensory protein